jgi:hypothetical protein
VQQTGDEVVARREARRKVWTREAEGRVARAEAVQGREERERKRQQSAGLQP